MNNILFLDFDGPMFNNKTSTYSENNPLTNQEKIKELKIHPFFKYWKMDVDMVNLINFYAQDDDFRLVISSSWANSRMNEKENIKKLLFENGIQAVLHDNWTSQVFNGSRVEQIKYWLINNNPKKYLVFDDEVSGWSLAEQSLVDNVFLCDEDNGFSNSQINDFYNHFKNYKIKP